MDRLVIAPKVYKYPLIRDIVKDLKAPNGKDSAEGKDGNSCETVSPTECYLTRGNFEYFHYGCDDVNDNGWGCAYRSIAIHVFLDIASYQ